MCRWCEFEKLFESWSLRPSPVMWWLWLSLIVWSANHTWHGSLKSTIYFVSLYLSQASKLLIMPFIWKRENKLMAFDKKSDSTRFGSRSYTFLDWATTEKRIGREKTHFGFIWASPRIPDVSGIHTGRVRYERDYKIRTHPFSPNRLASSKSTQPAPLFLT